MPGRFTHLITGTRLSQSSKQKLNSILSVPGDLTRPVVATHSQFHPPCAIVFVMIFLVRTLHFPATVICVDLAGTNPSLPPDRFCIDLDGYKPFPSPRLYFCVDLAVTNPSLRCDCLCFDLSCTNSPVPLCPKSFELLRNTATTVDFQKIKLQEIEDDTSEAGRIPRTVEVELHEDLVDTCIPGLPFFACCSTSFTREGCSC